MSLHPATPPPGPFVVRDRSRDRSISGVMYLSVDYPTFEAGRVRFYGNRLSIVGPDHAPRYDVGKSQWLDLPARSVELGEPRLPLPASHAAPLREAA